MKWIATFSFQQKVAMAIEVQEEKKNESSKTKEVSIRSKMNITQTLQDRFQDEQIL
jgi:hypothetical protein